MTASYQTLLFITQVAPISALCLAPFSMLFTIFGKDSIILYNNSLVNQYNAGSDAPPLKVGTNSISSGAVSLKNSAKIDGDVAVGVGGNPSVVIDIKNSSVITGDTYAQTTPTELASVVVPSSLASLPSQGALSLANSKTQTLTSSAKYSSISLSNSSTLIINGNISLYITGKISLVNSSQITVNSNSSLTIYLGGNFDGGNSSNINNQTQNPHKAQLYGLDTCTKVGFKNSSAFYGTVYAPEASVTLYNSADIYGALIAKKFETKNSARIHYDASLKNVESADQAMKFTVKRWTEGL